MCPRSEMKVIEQFASSQFRAYPAAAIFMILAGACLAVLMIPVTGHESPTGLFWSSVVLSMGLIFGVAMSVMNSPASVFRAECILSLGLVYWVTLDPIQGAYGLAGTSIEAVAMAMAGTGLFAAAIWVGAMLPLRLVSGGANSITGDFAPGLVFWAGIATFCAGILQPMLACKASPLCFVESLFTPWDQVPWRTYKAGTSGSGLNTLLRYLGYFGFLTLPMAVVLLRSQQRFSWRVAFLAFLGTLILILLVQSGARRIVGMLVASSGLIWILLRPSIRFRELLRLGIVALSLLLVLEAMVSWRKIGIGTGLIQGESLTGISRSHLISVDKNFYYMSHAMTVVPEHHPHKPVDGLLWAIGGPIPRSVWPSKPISRGIDLLPYIGKRAPAGFSWTCSAVCDLYLIGGAWAIGAGGLVFGVLAGLCNQLLFQPPSGKSRIMFGFGVMMLFIGLRSIRDLMAIGFFIMLCICLILLLRRLFPERERDQPPSFALVLRNRPNSHAPHH